jgi:hypothetical protein
MSNANVMNNNKDANSRIQRVVFEQGSPNNKVYEVPFAEPDFPSQMPNFLIQDDNHIPIREMNTSSETKPQPKNNGFYKGTDVDPKPNKKINPFIKSNIKKNDDLMRRSGNRVERFNTLNDMRPYMRDAKNKANSIVDNIRSRIQEDGDNVRVFINNGINKVITIVVILIVLMLLIFYFICNRC